MAPTAILSTQGYGVSSSGAGDTVPVGAGVRVASSLALFILAAPAKDGPGAGTCGHRCLKTTLSLVPQQCCPSGSLQPGQRWMLSAITACPICGHPEKILEPSRSHRCVRGMLGAFEVAMRGSLFVACHPNPGWPCWTDVTSGIAWSTLGTKTPPRWSGRFIWSRTVATLWRHHQR
jgi:hypothetical protein